MKKTIFIYIFIAVAVFFGIVYYNSGTGNDIEIKEDAINVYFFWAPGCPYCENQKRWIREMEEKHENVNFLELEAGRNSRLFSELLALFEVPANMRGSVPATFVGSEYFIGFSGEIGEEIENEIKRCLELGNCSSILKE